VEEKERLKVVVEKLNEDYGISFEEADRVVNAIKHKLEGDDELRAAFKTNSIEFLRRQKLKDSINDAFLSNADEFLNFMSKTETDPALEVLLFGNVQMVRGCDFREGFATPSAVTQPLRLRVFGHGVERPLYGSGRVKFGSFNILLGAPAYRFENGISRGWHSVPICL